MHKQIMYKYSAMVLIAITALTGSLPSYSKSKTPTGDITTASILINQVGYKPKQSKVAVVPNTNTTEFTLIDNSTRQEVYKGALSESKVWSESKEFVKTADFSKFQQPGEYTLHISGLEPSPPLIINNNVYNNALKAAIKYYYFNRNSIALKEQYAGVYQRPMSHPDKAVSVHKSAATKERPKGTKLSLPKGWFDAGDFGKYTVNSSIAVHTLLRALENYPEHFKAMHLNIPESNHKTPDLLEEIIWNLDWMVSMQDSDGGLYHKLTTKKFAALAMPHTQHKKRFVVQKTTAATLNYAATLAVASRIFKQYEYAYPDRSLRYKESALKAWEWAMSHPDEIYKQPRGFTTGQYRLKGDNYEDEWSWARAELFVLTGDDAFLQHYKVAKAASVPEWSNVETLGIIALVNYEGTPNTLKTSLLRTLKKSADHWVNEAYISGYGVAMFGYDFRWGSNAVAANKAMVLYAINTLIPNPEYVQTAEALLDYLLGRNPNNISYMTGFGTYSAKHPHHRVSAADNIEEPIPGMLVGGPHRGHQDKKDCKKNKVTYNIHTPAKAYIDHWCSYATNEVAINWNAALVYILAEANFSKASSKTSEIQN